MKLMLAPRLVPTAAGLLLLALVGVSPAIAGDGPVAIVEDTSGNVAGVETFDLLARGKKIKLPADGGVIISYLNSCQRENIRGGEVTIGETQSEVSGGEVGRSRVACDPAALNLTPEQANQSATLMFRPAPLEEGIKFLSLSQQPVVIAPDLTEITVTNMKDKTKTWVVKMVKGVAEITADQEPLERAGVYQLSGGGRSLIFRVGKEATSDPLPILRRAIRL